MKISTRGRYALRLMIDLAQNMGGGYVPLRDIAQRQNISVKYLEQIVPMLVRAGLVRSVRGNSGGYRLAAEPEQIIVGDILRAAEGSLAPIACLENDDCPRRAECCTIEFWSGLDNVITEYVDSFRLSALSAGETK